METNRKITTFLINQDKLVKIEKLSIEIDESNKDEFAKYLELYWKLSHYLNTWKSEYILHDFKKDDDYFYLTRYQEDSLYNEEDYVEDVETYWDERDTEIWRADEGIEEWEEKYGKR